MKTIHWILLAGLGYYLYSQKSKTATAMLPIQPAPDTWIFDQKTGLISVQGQKIDPGPAPIADPRAEYLTM
jgi:hypothetical protein